MKTEDKALQNAFANELFRFADEQELTDGLDYQMVRDLAERLVDLAHGKDPDEDDDDDEDDDSKALYADSASRNKTELVFDSIVIGLFRTAGSLGFDSDESIGDAAIAITRSMDLGDELPECYSTWLAERKKALFGENNVQPPF